MAVLTVVLPTTEGQLWSGFLPRLQQAPPAAQWVDTARSRAQAQRRAFTRLRSAEECLAGRTGQPCSPDDVTAAREGAAGRLCRGRGPCKALAFVVTAQLYPCGSFQQTPQQLPFCVCNYSCYSLSNSCLVFTRDLVATLAGVCGRSKFHFPKTMERPETPERKAGDLSETLGFTSAFLSVSRDFNL